MTDFNTLRKKIMTELQMSGQMQDGTLNTYGGLRTHIWMMALLLGLPPELQQETEP